jgi:cold shock CspA family protein
MHRGSVKWFNSRDRYGFIVPESGDGDDIFVSENLLAKLGIETLTQGRPVLFTAEPCPKGLRATGLVIL